MKNEIEKIKISNFDLIKKFEENKKEKKILHESYEKMKYFNYKILFDHFYKKEENQQNQPKANLDANTFVIWLNLLSIDNNLPFTLTLNRAYNYRIDGSYTAQVIGYHSVFSIYKNSSSSFNESNYLTIQWQRIELND